MLVARQYDQRALASKFATPAWKLTVNDVAFSPKMSYQYF